MSKHNKLKNEIKKKIKNVHLNQIYIPEYFPNFKNNISKSKTIGQSIKLSTGKRIYSIDTRKSPTDRNIYDLYISYLIHSGNLHSQETNFANKVKMAMKRLYTKLSKPSHCKTASGIKFKKTGITLKPLFSNVRFINSLVRKYS